jgi:uncharacterized protein (TIGR00255 family)
MLLSMTGFGRGEAVRDGHKATVELTSVNSRFLEFQFRVPRELNLLEPRFKEILAESFSRGKLSCVLVWERAPGVAAKITINEPLAEAYAEAFQQLRGIIGLSADARISDFVTMPDIINVEPAEIDQDLVSGITQEALIRAAAALRDMRLAEGGKIAQDLKVRLSTIMEMIPRIEQEFAGNIEAYREKMRQRIKELFGENGYDVQRLAEEVAYMAERADITEECVRLKIHAEHSLEALDQSEPVGRRMNFLMQEMNREANTIGSKAQSASISIFVVTIKEELEKIREQIQNIE